MICCDRCREVIMEGGRKEKLACGLILHFCSECEKDPNRAENPRTQPYKLRQRIKIEFQVTEVERIERRRKNKKTGKMELIKVGDSYILEPLDIEIFSDCNHEFRIDRVRKQGKNVKKES